jgi:F-type H+-transporting ATPase subunit b
MEQILDVFGIDWKILIVQVVNFTVLLALLWYLLYRPLLGLIEKRRTQIIEGVANAERAEVALKDADTKKAEIVTKASREAEGIVASARDAGKQKEAQLVREAEAKAGRIVAEANMRAEEAHREALLKSRDDIARLVVLGVEKTLREKVS